LEYLLIRFNEVADALDKDLIIAQLQHQLTLQARVVAQFEARIAE
jgi:hypothetical protein